MAAADEDLVRRVADLEASTSALRAEVADLKARLHSPRTVNASVASSPARESFPSPAPVAPTQDIESMVGRYGVLALATLTTLAAVGTFVDWAAAHGLLGPVTRVVLGLLLAAALAGTGLWLRRRERAFGSTLLGLALAVTHVCAWAAGPGLRLVPSSAAFALAAVASVALAVFAYFEHEEPLWCIGFGGAALAPFVTADRAGSAWLLASYGALVAVAGAAGIGVRAWRHAARTVAAAVAVYALALAFSSGSLVGWGPVLALALPMVVAAAGVLPASSGEFVRARLRAQGLIAAVAAVYLGDVATPLGALNTALVIGAAGTLWLVMMDVTADAPALAPQEEKVGATLVPNWVDGAAIPVLMAFAAVWVEWLTRWGPAGAAAIGAAVMAWAASRRDAGSLRDALAFSAAAGVLVACNAAPWAMVIAHPVADAAVGLLLAAALVWRPSYSWLYMSAAALVLGSAHAWVLLDGRPDFIYAPFATLQSAGAAVLLAAWTVVAWRADALAAALDRTASADAQRQTEHMRTVRSLGAIAPWVWGFLWAHRELAGAWSPAVATLALVSLEAGSAVAAVGVGRARSAGALRQVGLALAVVAAVRALAAAASVHSVSVRIASYLVASAFLLGIAYWYRRRGSSPAPHEGA